MKKEKMWNVAAVAIIILALVFTSVLAYCPRVFQMDSSATLYASSVFDKTKVMKVNIIMEEDAWEEMLENAASEEYSACDIEINGKRYNNVGIRPKGNTSLLNIVQDDTTDRFSFKVEFDHFEKGQSLDGLDKLSLNNIMADATYMKEYITYDILSYLGVNSSLFSYASIHHNGEYWGLYIAFEAIEDSFLQRTYGETDGKLYKPENMEAGQMEGLDDLPDAMKEKLENMFEEKQKSFTEKFEEGGDRSIAQGQDRAEDSKKSENNEKPDKKSADKTEETGTQAKNQQAPPDMPEGIKGQQAPPDMPEGFDGQQAPPDMPEGEQGKKQEGTKENLTKDEQQKKVQGNEKEKKGPGGGMGCSLAYIDDNYDSYQVIWEGSIDETVTDADKNRVITALKNISNKENIEEYLDVDQMLRFIAANVLVSNDDSYFGNLLHNYYLYEQDGKLSMLPWDYNLAFSEMFMENSGDATQVVNRGIDDVVSSGTLEERPLLAAALSTDENMEKYHQYMKELIEGYFASGVFETTVAQIKKMIVPYVQSDPTAFYTYEEFEKGYDTLMEFIDARVESIQKQLDGEIPAKASLRTEKDTLVDGSGITISDMGTMFGSKGVPSFLEKGKDNQKQGAEGQKGQAPMMPGLKNSNEPSKAEQKNAWILTGISCAVLAAALVFLRIFKRRRYRAT
ncbi:CotH kinase family protein [[Clostridium] polysaccharolyticum]|uniref:CotH protein n=1 Tax=[Clostridium] polysaccharolyticum TaxID=29364 RepID=A0A1I0ARK5_9FIRM|nr:CotH kinase family protein [[Clostridium] polysaccharolyticum]SES96803.1 CotH protein [[Clostridium] polysaccharolyticum]